ncbi:uncharacterized protein LOC131206673 [Anopheles bellator]|uniref:uncharacterized protein LOC131206673 n=1 Tax=Anopheles bellator TaxID=139047 RepID=UPI0026481088|nr:uncharacterized protein LOC131206673 [Anopheles bellator]
MTTKVTKRKQHGTSQNGVDGVDEKTKKRKKEPRSEPSDEQTNRGAEGPVSVAIKRRNQVATTEVVGTDYVKEFRQMLKSGLAATDAIRHFLQRSYADPGLIVDYIRTGGTVKQLLDLLSSCEADNLPDIAVLLNLLHLVLIECVNYDKSHAEQAAKSAKTLLTEFRTVIVKVLRDRTADHTVACRTAGFRILKAILLVDAAAHGKDILRQLDVTLPELEMHKCRESKTVTVGGRDLANETLRTVFIDFNLAFLIDTPPEIVRLWLSRSHLLHALTVNLVYDHAENVVLVMKSLRQYVLECPAVDKYLYRTVFTTDILKALVNGYEWVGPEKVAPREEMKQTIFAATEEVVMPLLTSRRHFLVPKAIDVGRASSRHKHVLLALKNSQLHDHQRRLVLRVFETCPEMLPAVLENFGSLLKTRQAASRDLVLAILRLHKPEDIVAAFEPGITAKLVSHFIVKSTLPSTVLEYIGVAIGEHRQNIPFCLKFLCTMITRCEEYMVAIERHRGTLDQFDMKRIKFDVINQILALFPSIDRIIVAMTTHRDDRTVKYSNVALEHAMDILLVCIRSFPAYIESSSFITTYRDILKPAYRTPAAEHFYLNYEFKAIKVVIALEPQSVSFGSALFPSVLKLVAKVYLNGSPEMKREATELLLALFRKTTLFGHRGAEIEFWFRALYDAKPTVVPELVEYLAQSARTASCQLSQQSATNSTAPSAGHSLIDEAFVESGVRRTDLDALFTRVEQEEEGTTTAAASGVDFQVEELPVTDNFFVYMFDQRRLHPAKFRRYLDAVLLRYFHYLPHPEIVERAVRKMQDPDPSGTEQVASRLNKYIRKWMTGKECVLDEEWGLLGTLSRVLVAKDKGVVLDPANGGPWRNTRSDLLHLLHETIFCVSRWIVAGTLTQAQLEVASFYVHRLLELLLGEGTLLSDGDRDELMAGLFLQRPVLFQHFTIIVKNEDQATSTLHRLVTGFVYGLMEKLQHLPHFDRYTALYSNKVVTELIRTSTERQQASGSELDGALVQKLLGIFELNETHCRTLLRHYAALPGDAFVKGNERSYHYQQLCLALKKLASGAGTGAILSERTVHGLVRLYMELATASTESSLDELETALLGYFSVFTHAIAFVDVPLMTVLFEKRQRVGKPLVKLACFLFARDSRFDGTVLELIGQHTTKKELVYPLLDVAFQRSVFDVGESSEDDTKRRLLAKLYAEFKGGIQKTLEKPHKAAIIYRENTNANVRLVRACMPRNECVDFARKKLRIEGIEPFQLAVLMEIYGRALEASQEDGMAQTVVYGNVFVVLLQCFDVLFRTVASGEYFLQRPDSPVEKLNDLVQALYGWACHARRHKALQEMSYAAVTGSAAWNSFCKTCLKLGIDMPRCATNARRYDHRLYVLPKLMAVLVDRFYANDIPPEQAAAADIERYYDWALTHTNSLRVLLTQYEFAPKTYLVYLLLVLARKNPRVADRKHVPILLGAYGATLTDTNRYILALLQHYEQRAGVEMHEFRPFLWGETAIKHFSLESNVGAAATTTESDRTRSRAFRVNNVEVFSLLSKDRIRSTIEDFPVWRKLDSGSQLPAVNFDNLSEDSATAAGSYQPVNEVQRFVEHHRERARRSKQLLTALELKPEQRSKVYDPAFLIPMLGYLFSPENPDMLNLAGRIGALSLPFLCLASDDERMRLAAASVIVRIRGQLEQTRHFIDSKFWLHLFGAVQRGLAVTIRPGKGHEAAEIQPLPKVPLLSTIFIAETINLLPEVLSPLHGPLTRYILHREAFDFRAIPNFMALFHSADVKHNVHRSFMLATIQHGLQTHDDFVVLRGSPIIRVMMTFYASPLSNRELNILILNSLNALTKIPRSCEVLVNSLGFVSWIHERIDAIEGFQFDTIEAFLGMLTNCWYSMQTVAIDRSVTVAATNQKAHGSATVPFHRSVLIATLKFLPLLSTRSSSKTLIRFLHLLDRTTGARFANERLLTLVSDELLQQMIEYFEKMFGDHLWCVRYVRLCGSGGCDDDTLVGRKLTEAGIDRTTVAIVTSLRRFVIRWQNYQKRTGVGTPSEEHEEEEAEATATIDEQQGPCQERASDSDDDDE